MSKQLPPTPTASIIVLALLLSGVWGVGGGRVVRWCWGNLQCLLIWIRLGQGPTALVVGACGGLFGHFFSLVCHFSILSPSMGDGPI